MRKLALVMGVAVLIVPLAWGASGIGLFWTYFEPDGDAGDGWGGGAKLKVELAPNVAALELRASYISDFGADAPYEDDNKAVKADKGECGNHVKSRLISIIMVT